MRRASCNAGAWFGAAFALFTAAALGMAKAETEPPTPVPAPAPTQQPKHDPATPANPSAPSTPTPNCPVTPGPFGASAGQPAVPFPYPLITEVLFAVPSGPEGDANKDGTRHVSGDEFVELVNPHDKPIQLAGYTLMNSARKGKAQFKFTFPPLEVPPHGVVVVFNGNSSTWTGPVGDTHKPPTGPNDLFDGAFVFTMRASSQRYSFTNAGDSAMIASPDGKIVHHVHWGKADSATSPGPVDKAPPQALLDETAPVAAKCSVQRESIYAGAPFLPHVEFDRMSFSPGKFSFQAGPPPAKPAKPDPARPASPEPGPGK